MSAFECCVWLVINSALAIKILTVDREFLQDQKGCGCGCPNPHLLNRRYSLSIPASASHALLWMITGGVTLMAALTSHMSRFCRELPQPQPLLPHSHENHPVQPPFRSWYPKKYTEVLADVRHTKRLRKHELEEERGDKEDVSCTLFCRSEIGKAVRDT